MSRSHEVFLLFLRLGCTSFGGPLAHTALFEEEFVKKRGWLSSESFLRHLAITQMIPGPNSTELAMHIGHARAGWPGFFLAGIAFIMPAASMVALLAWLYVQGGGFEKLSIWVWGAMPVVAAIILVMIVRAARKSFRSWSITAPVSFGFLVFLLNWPLWSCLMVAAGSWLLFFCRQSIRGLLAFVLATLPFFAPQLPRIFPNDSLSLGSLFTQMFYLGSIVLGSGYVLFSYYSSHFVEGLRWIDAQELGIAIAAAQLTPGPLFASAAFIGMLIKGFPGAAVCVIGIFLPAFIFSAISVACTKWMENSSWWESTLRVLGALSILIMGREALRLIPLYVNSPLAMGIFGCALVAHLRFRVSSTILILSGAVAGAVSHLP